jgi:hypothetical protein
MRQNPLFIKEGFGMPGDVCEHSEVDLDKKVANAWASSIGQ